MQTSQERGIGKALKQQKHIARIDSLDSRPIDPTMYFKIAQALQSHHNCISIPGESFVGRAIDIHLAEQLLGVSSNQKVQDCKANVPLWREDHIVNWELSDIGALR